MESRILNLTLNVLQPIQNLLFQEKPHLLGSHRGSLPLIEVLRASEGYQESMCKFESKKLPWISKKQRHLSSSIE